jgi:hypothetical protein
MPSRIKEILFSNFNTIMAYNEKKLNTVATGETEKKLDGIKKFSDGHDGQHLLCAPSILSPPTAKKDTGSRERGSSGACLSKVEMHERRRIYMGGRKDQSRRRPGSHC